MTNGSNHVATHAGVGYGLGRCRENAKVVGREIAMRAFMIAMVFVAAAASPTCAQENKVVGEDLRVPHGDGVQIFVRNKRPEGVQTFKTDRIAIMMHGATYPGTSFDLPLAGKSWMDYMAERGFDVYALDLPGYGRSTRLAAMDLPPDQNPP